MDDRFRSIKVGDEAELVRTITEEDIATFVQLTGDDNPLHVDDGFAAQTSFQKRVVHGMLTASFVSTIIGVKLVGRGALWYEQSFQFLAPVRVGETIRVWGRIKQISEAQRIVVVEIIVFGSGDRKVLTGEGKVRVLEAEQNKGQVMTEKKDGAIIVTGASRGIGAAVARELAAMGYPVVLNCSRDVGRAEEVAGAIRSSGGRAAVFQADVRDAAAIKGMVDFAIAQFGSLKGVVNNASGPLAAQGFSELKWDDLQSQIDVHVKGSFLLCQEALKHLAPQGHGVIVSISSIAADNVPPVKWTGYVLAKSALASLTRSIAAEYGPSGIRANCVAPGLVETQLTADVPDKSKMIVKMQAPLRKLATPEDVAGVVGFLFSDKTGHVSGETVRVCGGIVMGS